MTSDLLARIASGDSPRREMQFSFGSAVEAFSIGSAGNWQISGPEIRPIHAFLHFDGETIFALSTADEEPALLNGVQLPRTWTPLPIPAVMSLGGTSITFGVTSGEADTRLIHMPLPARERSRPPPPPPPLPQSSRADSEFAPVAARPSRPPPPRPGSGSMFRGQPPPPQTTVFVHPEHARARSAAADAPERDGTTVRSKTKLRQARIRRIALGVVGVILIGLVSLSSLRGRSAAAPPPARVGTSEPLPQSSEARPAATEVSAAAPTQAPASEASTAPDAATLAPRARPATVRVLVTTAAAAREAASGGDDRAAADAVARGESDVALLLYTKLALANPQQRAFAVAQQILESKARVREGTR